MFVSSMFTLRTLGYQSCEITSHSFEGFVHFKPSCFDVSCVFAGCCYYRELEKSVMPVITPSKVAGVWDANITLQRLC